MSHVEPFPGGVREHVEAIELLLVGVKAWFAGVGNVVHLLLFPPLLTPGFDVLGERAVIAERGRLIRMCVFGHGARILNTLLDAVA